MPIYLRRLFLCCSVFLLLAACTKSAPPKEAFTNTDVTGLSYAKDFSLTDFNGQRKTLADFKGKAVVVFFGFTQCPDVCPTTLAAMATVMKQLGPDADKVAVLFVTIDPQRDTPAILKQYVPAFDSRFIGLYGTQQETDQVVKDFKVFVSKVPGKTADDYTFDHTAGSYVFDPAGHIRLFLRNDNGPDSITHDLKILLAGD